MSEARRQLRRIETAMRLHDKGKVDWAYAHYLKILERDPYIQQVLCNIGGIELDRGDIASAEARYRLALDYFPDSIVASSGLSVCLSRRHAPDEAIATSLRMLEHNNDNPKAYYSHGLALANTGDTVAALKVIENGLKYTRPGQTKNGVRKDLLLSRGLLRIGSGDYLGGFEDRAKYAMFRDHDAPLKHPLTMEYFKGRNVMIHPEEGNGDGVALGRFIRPFAASGAKLSIACRPAMRRLWSDLRDIAELVPEPNATGLNDYDSVVPMVALPHILRSTLETLPPPVELYVPQDSIARGLSFTAGYERALKVGFCWSGSTGYADNYSRSTSLDQFLGLTDIPNTKLFSLYKGPLLTDLFKHPDRENIIDTSSSDRDYADAAGTIAAMDLVVTTDTCVAHLAGSLGKETWMLLHHAPYYYYPKEFGEVTPWYPSMRLFRQEKSGDWDDLFARVRTALTERVSQNG